eukprot:TRINITY_DN18491_c0_g1_i2.p1 TRINITY_DN18491_c0_g1~~TRINITY_DN18491_c0_g1_i2.p1  ORF type:complete len:315 (-),score=19.92 TRINITY_DN18491_c0_g1_i2:153-962(-)
MDLTSLQLPFRTYALMVSLQTHAVPHLVRVDFGINYPFHPMKIQFMSRVPHPLISEDGSIDVDILNHEWSPALALRSVLVSLQSVLVSPTDPDIFRPGCIRNLDWELGAFATPPQHAPTLFNLLLRAAQPPRIHDVPAWFSWRFLRGLRSLLCMHPLVYKTSSRAWFRYLRTLASDCTSHRNDVVAAEPSAPDEARKMWIKEARALLMSHFRFDGLRCILCARGLGNSLGNLRGVFRVWSEIRAFLSDIEDEELFAGNRILLRLVENTR